MEKVQYKGAYVKEPEIGMHKNIIVLDFRSLYPSIIITHNISPETLDCRHKECKKNKSPEFERWFCTKVKGKVPERLERILKDRAKIKKQLKSKLSKKEREKLEKKEHQYKLAANITYGYFGYKKSEWFNIKCAEAIAAFGRFYLHKIIKEAGKEFKVIYADTDGLFLIGSVSKAKQFVKRMNKALPGVISLEYRGLYKQGLFVSREGRGTKKKYALIDKKGELFIRGFETRRGDWCLLAKSVQREILKLILTNKKKKAVNHTKEVIENLKKYKVKLSDLVISVQLTKPLSDYKAIGPHVAVALKLKSQGKKIEPEMFIKFIVTKGEGSISERAKPAELVKIKEVDTDYYIYHQIIPASLRVLGDFGVSKEDLVEKGLKKFVKK